MYTKYVDLQRLTISESSFANPSEFRIFLQEQIINVKAHPTAMALGVKDRPTFIKP